MAYHCIYQLVYSRQGEGVFWTGFVQVRKVYTHPPLLTFLFYYHDVGQLFKVEYLLDSPHLLKLHHLVSNSVKMIFE